METERTVMVEEEEKKIKKVKPVIRSETPEPDILKAVSLSGVDPDGPIKSLADHPGPVMINRTITSTGFRVSTQMKQEVSEGSDDGVLVSGLKLKSPVEERVEGMVANKNKVSVIPRMSFDDFLKATNTQAMTIEEYLKSQAKEEPVKESGDGESGFGLNLMAVRVKEGTDDGFEKGVVTQNEVKGSNDQVQSANDESPNAKVKQEVAEEVVKPKSRIQSFEELVNEFDHWCQANDRSRKDPRVEGMDQTIKS
ncbi:hypothetical protein PanWU01x14_353760 [Parasponia andersonii]|uniref:Uncharacterized protein n=1 Tax=Parasponia andersonii TaxID=3476 RepID=A0A2P5A9Y2_PARAD|nr:hypothetical protein PanWU01x14_353760 [Parasponia andersonii]